MKAVGRVLMTVAIALISAGTVVGQDARSDLDALIRKWTNALTSEDIDSFLDCYWGDAIRVNYNPDGTAELTEGIAALRAEEEESFSAIDFAALNLEYDEPVRFFPQDANPVYIYPNSRYGFMDVFEFELRRGRYRIVRQYLMPHPTAE